MLTRLITPQTDLATALYRDVFDVFAALQNFPPYKQVRRNRKAAATPRCHGRSRISHSRADPAAICPSAFIGFLLPFSHVRFLASFLLTFFDLDLAFLSILETLLLQYIDNSLTDCSKVLATMQSKIKKIRYCYGLRLICT